MIAETPNLDPAIESIRQFADKHGPQLSSAQIRTLSEIGRRLQRLGVQAAKLTVINNRLLAKKRMSVRFDPATETVIFSSGDTEHRLKLNRADPNVPISEVGSFGVAAYQPDLSAPSDDEEEELRLALEEKLESYYHNAHRVLKLLGTIPLLVGIKCTPLSLVRNKLVEHAEEGALYSFGVGSAGARIKPLYQGTPVWTDDGLVPNTRAFVDAIVAGCKGHAP